jgi:heptosyltransferase-2/heptosyltransferase-3
VTRPRTTRLLGADYLAPTWYPRAALLGLATLDRVRRATGRHRPSRPCPELARASIAIVKPDHLGDLLQATPLLRALRDSLPEARLQLVHGRWTRALAAWLRANGYVDALVEYDAAWLHAPGTPWRVRLANERTSRATAAGALRAAGTDVLLDIRCTSPTALPLARAVPGAWRAGFGLRGGAWEYDALVPYDERVPLPQNWLHVLPVLGLAPRRYRGPVLPPVPPPGPDAPIVVQIGSRTRAKEAPASTWRALLPRLAALAPITLVGSADERARTAPLAALDPARITDRTGTTDVPGLLALVAGARAIVGTDSIAATIALGHARPTAVLVRDGMGSASLPDDAPSLRVLRDDAPPDAVLAALRDAGLGA